jgi:hypothetical protein
MHYHLEIIMPPTEDIVASVAEIMTPFDENGRDEDGEANQHAFWDFYSIGGCWAGYKAELGLDQRKLQQFRQWLLDEKVMVKGVICGKQELADVATIAKVDTKWREMFPDGGDRCTLFRHSNDPYKEYLPGDVLRICALPEKLTASHVIIAAPRFSDENKLEASYMIQESAWNGVKFMETKWDGLVLSAVAMYRDKLSRYAEDWREKCTPREDWVSATVDYHS